MATPEVNLISEPLTDTQAWHEQRRKGIGGSDVHHLFPVLDLDDDADTGSRYGCPRQLAYEKLGTTPDYHHTPETLAMFERGHYMEQAAADKYAAKTGRKVFRSNRILQSAEYPWMLANIDRRIKADERGIGVLECKSAFEFVFQRISKEGLPMGYALQFQHYLIVTGATWGAFAVIQPDTFQFLYFELEHNPELAALLIVTERNFWSLIDAGKLPDPLPKLSDDRCKECLFRRTCRGAEYDRLNARLVRDPKEGIKYVQIDDPNLVKLVTQRMELDGTIKNLEEYKKQADVEIKQCFPEGRDALILPTLNGAKLRWREQAGARRWDSSALDGDAALLSEKLGFDFLAKYKAQGAPTRPLFVTPGKELQ